MKTLHTHTARWKNVRKDLETYKNVLTNPLLYNQELKHLVNPFLPTCVFGSNFDYCIILKSHVRYVKRLLVSWSQVCPHSVILPQSRLHMTVQSSIMAGAVAEGWFSNGADLLYFQIEDHLI